MRKIIMTATLAFAAMAMAAPAHADNETAPTWTFAPASVCGLEGAEVAVPILAYHVPIHSNSCSNGNLLSHPSI
ncbi:hypothetical protein [Streptomyces alanosinicus]|uniref:Chaplin n=1 Tax=Streptomyces alanosinicus TaxID=68171 RepID=A0A918YNG1_9ACTN|nr:hypothetical protein [Streptomyces alanosinicus]GHE07705.1 hypothetical protein GCM10010339_53500 [Streptomyces alanosinicus]